MSRPRHKRKHLFDGQRVHVEGPLGEYDAVIRFTNAEGHSVLEECVRSEYRARLKVARAYFVAAEDLPIPGWPRWYAISDFPVELSRHTTERWTGRTYTRAVMDLLGYAA